MYSIDTTAVNEVAQVIATSVTNMIPLLAMLIAIPIGFFIARRVIQFFHIFFKGWT